jgi:16S rRNA (guanine966-N2)-methyltransferase
LDSLGKIRIIGGKWRGRKLNVIKAACLRPTPDRLRETLFNWINKKVVGARCLDLFSGTGVLSFEALSRGASDATMIESNPSIVEFLIQTAEILESKSHYIECTDAIRWSKEQTKKFDIIFLDPPFGKGYVEKCCQIIFERSLLDEHGILYIESEKDVHIPSVFKINKITKTKKMQSVLAELSREN